MLALLLCVSYAVVLVVHTPPRQIGTEALTVAQSPQKITESSNSRVQLSPESSETEPVLSSVPKDIPTQNPALAVASGFTDVRDSESVSASARSRDISLQGTVKGLYATQDPSDGVVIFETSGGTFKLRPGDLLQEGVQVAEVYKHHLIAQVGLDGTNRRVHLTVGALPEIEFMPMALSPAQQAAGVDVENPGVFVPMAQAAPPLELLEDSADIKIGPQSLPSDSDRVSPEVLALNRERQLKGSVSAAPPGFEGLLETNSHSRKLPTE